MVVAFASVFIVTHVHCSRINPALAGFAASAGRGGAGGGGGPDRVLGARHLEGPDTSGGSGLGKAPGGFF